MTKKKKSKNNQAAQTTKGGKPRTVNSTSAYPEYSLAFNVIGELARKLVKNSIMTQIEVGRLLAGLKREIGPDNYTEFELRFGFFFSRYQQMAYLAENFDRIEPNVEPIEDWTIDDLVRYLDEQLAEQRYNELKVA